MGWLDFLFLPRGNASTHSCFIVLSLMLKPTIPYTQIEEKREGNGKSEFEN
jgi:hypothetical protein